MDFSHLTDIPVVDGHIHFRHPERADGIFAVMDAVPLFRVQPLTTKHWNNPRQPQIR